MRLNWMGYQFRNWDGYGRYGSHMIRALLRRDVCVTPLLTEHANMPHWMLAHAGIDLTRLTIACLPPFIIQDLPGRQWLLSMTEGSELPPGWAEAIRDAGVERVIVPCEHNARAFAEAGLPVHVVPGGTDPEEFPVVDRNRDAPYTFLALADRGGRKGWVEVWQAWWQAFRDTPDVALIIKARPEGNGLLSLIARAEDLDPRIRIVEDDLDCLSELYAQADCFAIPARSEGWGMPQREAAMSGLPVIVTRHSGIDDGYTDEWAIVVEKAHPGRIAHAYDTHIAGEWMLADVDELAATMRWCYEHPREAAAHGRHAASWLREHQTWDHAAAKLHELLEEYA